VQKEEALMCYQRGHRFSILVQIVTKIFHKKDSRRDNRRNIMIIKVKNIEDCPFINSRFSFESEECNLQRNSRYSWCNGPNSSCCPLRKLEQVTITVSSIEEKTSYKKEGYIPPIFDEDDQGLSTIAGKLFRVRLLRHKGRIDFAMDEDFNRWATCIKFSTSIPRNEKQWNKKIRIIQKILKKDFDNGLGYTFI
jgi:hypothetical protein